MSIIDSISLFAAMAALALVPSTSVVLVVTRSVTSDIKNGIATAMGIVLGDLVFILLAILGLSVIAETMGGLFLAIKYIGGAYLVWLGIQLLKSKQSLEMHCSPGKTKGSIMASFFAGLLLTLGDIKAIFFYVSLFPAFIDMPSLGTVDILIIVLITIIAVGGVKVGYAMSARKIITMSKGLNLENSTRKLAGGFLAGTGGYILVKA
jgi:threonine/homoserine/homoserine lactone efflux protein